MERTKQNSCPAPFSCHTLSLIGFVWDRPTGSTASISVKGACWTCHRRSLQEVYEGHSSSGICSHRLSTTAACWMGDDGSKHVCDERNRGFRHKHAHKNVYFCLLVKICQSLPVPRGQWFCSSVVVAKDSKNHMFPLHPSEMLPTKFWGISGNPPSCPVLKGLL